MLQITLVLPPIDNPRGGIPLFTSPDLLKWKRPGETNVTWESYGNCVNDGKTRPITADRERKRKPGSPMVSTLNKMMRWESNLSISLLISYLID